MACLVDKRSADRILVGRSEGKRPLGRRRHRWVDNVRIGFQEVVRANELDFSG